MAHLIFKSDNILTIGELPWHGLGINLPPKTRLSPSEAMSLAGLDWSVRKEKIFLAGGRLVEDNFAIVREDTGNALGIVGKCYEVYQNEEMFGFMDRFCQMAGTDIETCGSLRDGRTVWGLSRSSQAEYVKGDPIEKYFLVKTSHDGSSTLDVIFTDVRVVCANTLSAALANRRNRMAVPHTANMRANVEAVGMVLNEYAKQQEALARAMGLLAKTRLNKQVMREMAVALTARGAKYGQNPEAERDSREAGQILRLAETGMGTDIPGVRGTAYGWLNAVTEYVDHYRLVRSGGPDKREARFEASMNGSGARLKQAAFQMCLQMAA
jgi:phage/plasmid-like protein (TIGR03299 family)